MIVNQTFKKVAQYFNEEHGIKGVTYRISKRQPSTKQVYRNTLRKLCETKVISINQASIDGGLAARFFIHEFLHIGQYKNHDLKFGKGYSIKWCEINYRLCFNVNHLGYYYKAGNQTVSYPVPWEVGLIDSENLILKTLKLEVS